MLDLWLYSCAVSFTHTLTSLVQARSATRAARCMWWWDKWSLITWWAPPVAGRGLEERTSQRTSRSCASALHGVIRQEFKNKLHSAITHCQLIKYREIKTHAAKCNSASLNPTFKQVLMVFTPCLNHTREFTCYQAYYFLYLVHIT